MTLSGELARRAILAQVRATPGILVGKLASDLGVDYKVALWHARILARDGALVLAREGRWRRCYLPEDAPPDEPFSRGGALGAAWSRSTSGR